jgi:hypothetical protein
MNARDDARLFFRRHSLRAPSIPYMTMPRRARCAWWSTLVTSATLHGINSIRLRTFVPKASDGYDKANGNCDLAHTIAFGKQIKAAGMGLLVDFHYSDNWADPGKGGRAGHELVRVTFAASPSVRGDRFAPLIDGRAKQGDARRRS